MKDIIFIPILILMSHLLICTNLTWSATGDEDVKVEITLSEKYPIKGKECTVTINGISKPKAGENAAEVWVTYRPNSLVKIAKRLMPVGEKGVFKWTPEDAGICTITALIPEARRKGKLEAEDVPKGKHLADKNVAVRFGSFPPTGIIIFLIAGITLFGGMLWSMTKLMKRPYKNE